MLVVTAAVELVQVLRLTRSQSRICDCAAAFDALADNPFGQLTGAGRHNELAFLQQLDHDRAGGHQRATALGDQVEDLLQFGLPAERASDLDRRLEPAHGALQIEPGLLRTREPACMVDRHTCELRERHGSFLIIVAEAFGAELVRQIQVPVGLAGHEDRHPQKRLHRWMTDRKTVGMRMIADSVKPQGPGVSDQLTENAAAAREGADLLDDFLVDPMGQESDELFAGFVENAERRVLSSGQL